jgi:hypothetical protein
MQVRLEKYFSDGPLVGEQVRKYMDKFKASMIVGATLLLMSAGSVYADQVEITGNGTDSSNSVVLMESSSTVIVQENEAKIVNEVAVAGNSGGNEASGNTGGDVSIKTGDVSSDVAIVNKANENVAVVDTCCEEGGTTDVLIKNNGKDSDNSVAVVDTSCTAVVQENDAIIKNEVLVLGNSGGNEINGETGQVGGISDPSITTGGVDATIGIKNVANENVADVSTCCTEGGTDTITIKGNGKDSKNTVKSFSFTSKYLSQNNFAFVGNFVGVAGNTGGNEANGNTGGDVSIKTGKFDAFVSLFTKVNKNYAY